MLLAFSVCAARAQNYSVDWHKIAGGGGMGAAGTFSVSGTIGQPDACGVLTGGKFSLTGGFWSLYAVPTPGSPLLTIFLSGTNTAIVAWPAPSGGFVLQENSDPAATKWIAATNLVNVVNGTNQIIVASPVGNKFYRLFHP